MVCSKVVTMPSKESYPVIRGVGMDTIQYRKSRFNKIIAEVFETNRVENAQSSLHLEQK